jgi:hypothetical protein
MSQAEDNIDELDLTGVPEIFCERLGKIEQIGSCRRLIFVIHQTMNGRPYRVAAVKLVLPAEALVEVAQQLATDIHGPRLRESRSAIALAN